MKGGRYTTTIHIRDFLDEKIKQDIVDITKGMRIQIKVRKFKFKSDVTKYGDKAWSRIGVIAQELETVGSKLIKEMTRPF